MCEVIMRNISQVTNGKKRPVLTTEMNEHESLGCASLRKEKKSLSKKRNQSPLSIIWVRYPNAGLTTSQVFVTCAATV